MLTQNDAGQAASSSEASFADGLVNPSMIPDSTNLDGDAVQGAADAMATIGEAIKTAVGLVDTDWAGVQTSFISPQDAQIHTAIDPVVTDADTIKTKADAVKKALSTFATELPGIVREFDTIRTEAQTFIDEMEPGHQVWMTPGQTKDYEWDIDFSWTSEGRADHFREKGETARVADYGVVQILRDWKESSSHVSQNNGFMDRLADTYTKLQNAEADCANAINAQRDVCVAGVEKIEAWQLKQDDDPVSMPWGSKVTEDRNCGERTAHGFADAGKESLESLGSLISYNPVKGEWGDWENAGAAWKGMGESLGGLVLDTGPLNAVFGLFGTSVSAEVNKLLPGEDFAFQNGQEVALNMAKDLVAWDTWAEDPAEAAGRVSFNLLTALIPGANVVKGTALTAKIGSLAAKTAGRLGNFGKSLVHYVTPGGRPVHAGAGPDLPAGAGKDFSFDLPDKGAGPAASKAGTDDISHLDREMDSHPGVAEGLAEMAKKDAAHEHSSAPEPARERELVSVGSSADASAGRGADAGHGAGDSSPTSPSNEYRPESGGSSGSPSSSGPAGGTSTHVGGQGGSHGDGGAGRGGDSTTSGSSGGGSGHGSGHGSGGPGGGAGSGAGGHGSADSGAGPDAGSGHGPATPDRGDAGSNPDADAPDSSRGTDANDPRTRWANEAGDHADSAASRFDENAKLDPNKVETLSERAARGESSDYSPEDLQRAWDNAPVNEHGQKVDPVTGDVLRSSYGNTNQRGWEMQYDTANDTWVARSRYSEHPTDLPLKGDPGSWGYDRAGDRLPYWDINNRPSLSDGARHQLWDQDMARASAEEQAGGYLLRPDKDGVLQQIYRPLDKGEFDALQSGRSVDLPEGMSAEVVGDKVKVTHADGHTQMLTREEAGWKNVADAGHLPDVKYESEWKRYMESEGSVSTDEFRGRVANPELMRVEHPGGNRSHRNEKDDFVYDDMRSQFG